MKLKVKKKTIKKLKKHLPWLIPVIAVLAAGILIHKHPRDDYEF